MTRHLYLIIVNRKPSDFYTLIVDCEITYTRRISEVRKPRLPGDDSVNLFFEFTITDNQ